MDGQQFLDTYRPAAAALVTSDISFFCGLLSH